MTSGWKDMLFGKKLNITNKHYCKSKFSVIPWFRYRLQSSTLYNKAAIKHCNLLFLLYHQYIITTTFCKKTGFCKNKYLERNSKWPYIYRVIITIHRAATFKSLSLQIWHRYPSIHKIIDFLLVPPFLRGLM